MQSCTAKILLQGKISRNKTIKQLKILRTLEDTHLESDHHSPSSIIASVPFTIATKQLPTFVHFYQDVSLLRAAVPQSLIVAAVLAACISDFRITALLLSLARAIVSPRSRQDCGHWRPSPYLVLSVWLHTWCWARRAVGDDRAA